MKTKGFLRGAEDVARSRIVKMPWLLLLAIYMFVSACGAFGFACLYKAHWVSFFGMHEPALSSSSTVHGPLTLRDALYFSVVTQTTLGYGDIAPVSGWSRFIVCVQVFVFGLLLNGFLLGIVVAKVMFHTPCVVFSDVITHQGGDALQFRFYFDHAIPVLNITIACYLRLTPFPLGAEKRTPIQTRIVQRLKASTEHEPLMEIRAPIFVEVELPTAEHVAELRESMYRAQPGEAAGLDSALDPSAGASPVLPSRLQSGKPAYKELRKWDDIAVLVSGTRSDTGESIVGSKIYRFTDPDHLLFEGSFSNIEISFITEGRTDSKLIRHDWLNKID